jgi:hypothetical protein
MIIIIIIISNITITLQTNIFYKLYAYDSGIILFPNANP